jgi:hypothetical protein
MVMAGLLRAWGGPERMTRRRSGFSRVSGNLVIIRPESYQGCALGSTQGHRVTKAPVVANVVAGAAQRLQASILSALLPIWE